MDGEVVSRKVFQQGAVLALLAAMKRKRTEMERINRLKESAWKRRKVSNISTTEVRYSGTIRPYQSFYSKFP
jgi:hypothetical protein